MRAFAQPGEGRQKILRLVAADLAGPDCISVPALFHHALNPAVGNEPKQRDKYIRSTGNPRTHERERDGGQPSLG
jgi:hypothetical protein